MLWMMMDAVQGNPANFEQAPAGLYPAFITTTCSIFLSSRLLNAFDVLLADALSVPRI